MAVTFDDDLGEAVGLGRVQGAEGEVVDNERIEAGQAAGRAATTQQPPTRQSTVALDSDRCH